MRILELSVVDRPPIDRFEIRDLSDRIVVAGPNGVGKTKLLQYVQEAARNPTASAGVTLVLRATNRQEAEAGEKRELRSADPADAHALTATLQKNQLRRKKGAVTTKTTADSAFPLQPSSRRRKRVGSLGKFCHVVIDCISELVGVLHNAL